MITQEQVRPVTAGERVAYAPLGDRRRRAVNERTGVAELLLRINYMASTFWSSLSVHTHCEGPRPHRAGVRLRRPALLSLGFADRRRSPRSAPPEPVVAPPLLAREA